MVEQTFSIDRMEQAVSLFGSFDENIKLIEKEFQVRVICRGSEIKIQGDEENVDKTKNCVLEVNDFIKKSKTIKDEKFMSELPYYILKSFDNGINPTKRLLSILKQIEIEFPNEINNISIKNFANKYERYKQSRVYTYFCISNGQIDKKIPINYIMKDPVENLFI